ncbi:MAG: type II 3-dehydroquinate dehydratase [Lachnospiraceae bacterium]|nr:type II 3-dehydroquinate dehydratase [Lachnospiraceae bacterium]
MRIKVINGPNLNLLGIREPDIYGKVTYKDLVEQIKKYGEDHNIDIEVLQSNHEGDLVDMIQECLYNTDGIVINPGAYTHTSIALLDALKAVNIPAIEVHISEVDKRENFRQISYIRKACTETISGHGINGYMEAIEHLNDHINKL